MVDAVVKVGLKLFLDVFLGIADAGEMGNGRALAVLLDLVQNFQVLADVGAACAIGAGNVIGIQGVELFQHAAFAAQFFHADVGFGREHLKGEGGSVFIDLSNAHFCLQNIKIVSSVFPQRPFAGHFRLRPLLSEPIGCEPISILFYRNTFCRQIQACVCKKP